jgi:hypothetical protein
VPTHKKSFRGANASSKVTAAFSTSSSASPARISMYTNKRTALSSPAKGRAPVPKDVETVSRKSLGAPMEETRKETESPYTAFDHSLDEQDLLRESKKVVRRLLMDPIDKIIDEEENANAAKASTQASCIERHREQFKNAAQKKTGLSGTTCTSVEVFDTKDAEKNDGILEGSMTMMMRISATTHQMDWTKMTQFMIFL